MAESRTRNTGCSVSVEVVKAAVMDVVDMKEVKSCISDLLT